MVKYRLNSELRYACTSINTFIDTKTRSIGFLNNGYNKLAGILYDYATRDPQAAQAQARPQQQWFDSLLFIFIQLLAYNYIALLPQ